MADITEYTILDRDEATHRVMQHLEGKNDPRREAIVEWGEVLCESCDASMAKEGQTITIGFKCWRCATPVVGFDPIKKE